MDVISQAVHHVRWLVAVDMPMRPWASPDVCIPPAQLASKGFAWVTQPLVSTQGEIVDLAEVETLIHEFDIDGSGEVDLTEFIFVLALQRRTDYKRDDVLRCVLPSVSL
jgi:hypothetical protein